MYVPFAMYVNKLQKLDSLKIGNEHTIASVNSIKYIGIIFDCHLRWNEHTKAVITMLRCVLLLFNQLKKYLQLNHLNIVYFGLIESYLNFGIAAQGGVLYVHIHELEVIRILFLKIGNKYSTQKLFQDSSILDLKELFSRNVFRSPCCSKSSKYYVSHETICKITFICAYNEYHYGSTQLDIFVFQIISLKLLSYTPAKS